MILNLAAAYDVICNVADYNVNNRCDNDVNRMKLDIIKSKVCKMPADDILMEISKRAEKLYSINK